MTEMLITTIVSAVTGLGGFYYGVKKDKQDLVTKSFNNILLQISVYENIIEGLRSEIKTLTEKVEDQQKTIKQLEGKIQECIQPKNQIGRAHV